MRRTVVLEPLVSWGPRRTRKTADQVLAWQSLPSWTTSSPWASVSLSRFLSFTHVRAVSRTLSLSLSFSLSFSLSVFLSHSISLSLSLPPSLPPSPSHCNGWFSCPFLHRIALNTFWYASTLIVGATLPCLCFPPQNLSGHDMAARACIATNNQGMSAAMSMFPAQEVPMHREDES